MKKRGLFLVLGIIVLLAIFLFLSGVKISGYSVIDSFVVKSASKVTYFDRLANFFVEDKGLLGLSLGKGVLRFFDDLLVMFAPADGSYSDDYTTNITANPDINQSSIFNIGWDGTSNYYPMASNGEIDPAGPFGNGLVGLWHLNEISGNATDSSSNNNNGSVFNAIQGVGGKFNNAYEFDGVSGYVNIPDPNIVEGLNSMTVSAWVKPADASSSVENFVVQAGGGGGTVSWRFYWGSGSQVLFRVRNDSNYEFTGSSANNKMTDQAWHHVVGVYNGTNVYVYVDNVIGSIIGNYTGLIRTTSSNLQFGLRNLAEAFNGTIDEVAIWNRTLSANEIKNLYEMGGTTGEFESKLINTNGVFASLNASWIESGNGVNLSITNDETNWCSVSNGGVMNDPLCLGNNFKYKAHFNDVTTLDKINISWIYPDVCGDSIIGITEQCDDGGTSSGDGCSATCQIESGYSCTGQPSVCKLVEFFDDYTLNISDNLNINSSYNVTWDGISSYRTTLDGEINPINWNGLVGLWHFNELNGNAIDSSGSGSDGIVYGAIQGGRGSFNSGYSFENYGAYIDLGTPKALDLITNFTITGWVYPVGNNGGVILRRGDNTQLSPGFAQYQIGYNTIDNALEFWVGNGTDGQSDACKTAISSVPKNQWTFFASRINSTEDIRCYVNGEYSMEFPPGKRTVTGSTKNDTIIGLSNPGGSANQFNGSIDELAIWNRSLSVSEIQQLYQRGSLSGKINSTIINLGGSYNTLKVNWEITNPNAGKLFISSNGNNWCPIENGKLYYDTLCSELPTNKLMYRFDFNGNTRVDNINLSWTNVAYTNCSDLIDNDGDGAIDYPDDFGCSSPTDTSEINNGATQCSNGIDDDAGSFMGDGFIDQDDKDCVDRNDDNETRPFYIELDVPTPITQRISPAPVFASINFSNSTLGEGDWSQARILWKLSRVGGLNSWPAKYRYVTDPRPGGGQIDLSGKQFASGDYNGPRGFNMGWMLTEGTWTITANVTDIDGTSREISQQIIVNANTRTKIYVNSNLGNDAVGCGGSSGTNACGTLKYAMSNHETENNNEFIVAGGHEEFVYGSAPLMTNGGDNNYIHWDEQGVRPKIIDAEITANGENLFRVTQSSEQEVYEGLDFIANFPSVRGLGSNLFSIEKGKFFAFINLNITGIYGISNFYSLFPVKSKNTLIQSNVGGETGGYSVITSNAEVDNLVTIGNRFGDSVHESVFRTVCNICILIEKINVLYDYHYSGESKSTIRFLFGDYLHAYGNSLESGDFRLGNQKGSSHPLNHGRIESNYLIGKSQRDLELYCDVHDINIVNNLFRGDQVNLNALSPAIAGGFDCRGWSNDSSNDVSIASNSVVWDVEMKTPFSFGGNKENHSTATVKSNLIYVNSSFASPQISADTRVFYNFSDNVWTPEADYLTTNGFANIEQNQYLSFTQWQALPETSNEQAVSTTLDTNFVPTPKTSVPTPLGVYDDYYGNTRGTTSPAGAVVDYLGVVATCYDGIQNGGEAGVDCGGSCPACSVGLTPIARWDVVPYQRINSGETFNIGVIAFSKNGIANVTFDIGGHGYNNGQKVSTEMTYNPRTDVYEYWVPLSASEFSSDGVIEINATVYGKDGGIRGKNWLLKDNLANGYVLDVANEGGVTYSRLTKIGAFNVSWIDKEIRFYNVSSWHGYGARQYIVNATSDWIIFKEMPTLPINYNFIISDGLGLDQLILNVNPNSGLLNVKAWVDPVGGNDGTGMVDNINQPFESIRAATQAVDISTGRNLNGAEILLKPGEHRAEPNIANPSLNDNEWLYIRADSSLGADASNTQIVGHTGGSGYVIPHTRYIKIEGVRLVRESRYVFSQGQYDIPKPNLWWDKIRIIGTTRGLGYYPYSTKYNYYTNVYGTKGGGFGDSIIIRNVTINDSGEDAFQRQPLVVNAKIDTLDLAFPVPDIYNATYWESGHSSGLDHVIEKVGAFTNYNESWQSATNVFFSVNPEGWQIKIMKKISDDAIQLLNDSSSSSAQNRKIYLPVNGGNVSGFVSNGNHVDVWQWFEAERKTGPSSPHNTIVYNLRATNLRYQGIFSRPGSGKGNAISDGNAFVNVYLRFTSPIHHSNGGGGESTWSYSSNNMVIWNLVNLGDENYTAGFRIYDNDGPVVINDLSMKGLITGYYGSAQPLGGFVNYSDSNFNHYMKTSGSYWYNILTPGVDVTTGDPMLDAYGMPLAGSPLLDRVTPLVVPADANNHLRSDPGDVGAYEFQTVGGNCQDKSIGNNYYDDYTDESCVASKKNIIWDGVSNYSSVISGAEINPNSLMGNNLFGLWHMNNDVTDALGIHDGVISGTPDCTSSGKFNQGCKFTGIGSNNEVNLGDLGNIALAQEFTLSLWINKSNLGDIDIFSMGSWGIQARYTLGTNGNGVDFYLGNGISRCRVVNYGDNSITSNKWHNIVVVINATGYVTTYSDGVLRGEKDCSAYKGVYTGTNITTVGGGFSTHLLNGTIDEVAIWNRTLSANEIQLLYGTLVADLNSKTINTHGSFALLNASWVESGNTIGLEVSSDGTNWCSVSNGGVMTSSLCLGENFSYRFNFTDGANLDKVNISWLDISGCGDGLIKGLEECDDNNNLIGDGCSDICQIENGYSCTGEPSVCTSLSISDCNNGIDDDGDGLVDWEYDLGCYGPNDDEFTQPRNNENGWTTFDPSIDTKIIYVSSSTGNDTWSGLAPSWNGTDGPVKSVNVGKNKLRAGYPDWLLFKRGDSWKEESIGDLGISGKSESEPIVIGSYGASTVRPMFNISLNEFFSTSGYRENIALIGLHIYVYTKDPSNPLFTGIGGAGLGWSADGGNFLMEDMRFDYGQVNIQGSPTKKFALRRNILNGMYSVGSHAQNLFTHINSSLLIEENVAVHGGWNEDFRLLSWTDNKNVNDWKTISDGQFTIKLNGTLYNVSGLDFTGANSMYDVASIIKTGINSAVSPIVTNVIWKESGVFMLTIDSYKSDKYDDVCPYQGSVSGTDLSGFEYFNKEKLYNSSFVFRSYPGTGNYLDWKTISDGRFQIIINQTYLISNVDFSGVISMTDVATTLENSINQKIGSTNVLVNWNGSILEFSTTLRPGCRYGICDYVGVPGTSISRIGWLNSSCAKGRVPESTLYNRNMYLSSGYGNTITRGNIDANGASGGMQQRMGGISEDNLFLNDPGGVDFGMSENYPGINVSGRIVNNVILGARDIDTQPHGGGISLSSFNQTKKSGNIGGPSFVKNVVVSNNIIAHNRYGTGNIAGILIGGDKMFNVTVANNIVYNWTKPVALFPDDHRAWTNKISISENSVNVSFKNNILQQPDNGALGQTYNGAAGVTLENNTYYSASQDPPGSWESGWFTNVSTMISYADWVIMTGEINPKKEKVNFVDPGRDIETYMASIGGVPTYKSFIEEAKNQSKYNWRNEYTSYAVNDYIRAGFITTGGGPVPCSLTSASWSPTTAFVGNSINLSVIGSNCGGVVINYTIWKDVWWWFDQKVMASSVQGTSSWIAGLKSDGSSQTGTYYFEAVSSDGVSSVVTSPQLVVNVAPANTCLNADVDSSGGVDINDLIHIARKLNGSDVTGDGITDIFDLVYVATKIGCA